MSGNYSLLICRLKRNTISPQCLSGGILVFGGFMEEVMFKVSEEGKLLSDLSSDTLIPGWMGFNSFASERGKVLTAL